MRRYLKANGEVADVEHVQAFQQQDGLDGEPHCRETPDDDNHQPRYTPFSASGLPRLREIRVFPQSKEHAQVQTRNKDQRQEIRAREHREVKSPPGN